MSVAGSSSTPTVAVVVPVFNQRHFLIDCLDSLARQDYDSVLFYLFDAHSTDGTREIIDALVSRDSRFRLVVNESATPATAMNLALDLAPESIIIRADVRALYEPDFISQSVEALQRSGVEAVCGPVRRVGATRFGRAAAAIVPRNRETVTFGCYRAQTLRALGGYNARTYWTGERDLNIRIGKTGGAVVCDPNIRLWYFGSQTWQALWQESSRAGVDSMAVALRHFRPPNLQLVLSALLVLVIAITVAVSGFYSDARWLLLIPLCAIAYALLRGLRLSRQPGVNAFEVALALTVFRMASGLAVFKSVMLPVMRRPLGARVRFGV